RAALARAMHDAMRDTAKRNDGAGLERRSLRQAPETRRNPAAMELCELARLRDRAARRHGEDGFAVGRMDAERISARAPVPAQPDRKDLRAMLDQKSRGF